MTTAIPQSHTVTFPDAKPHNPPLTVLGHLLFEGLSPKDQLCQMLLPDAHHTQSS